MSPFLLSVNVKAISYSGYTCSILHETYFMLHVSLNIFRKDLRFLKKLKTETRELTKPKLKWMNCFGKFDDPTYESSLNLL